MATRLGEIDGLVSAYRDRCDCDPRGRFIRRPELAEAQWQEYRRAFELAFERAIGRRS